MRPLTVTLNRLGSLPTNRFLQAGAVAALILVMLAATPAGAEEYNPVRKRPAADQATVQRVIVKFRDTSRVTAQAATNGESANALAALTTRSNALATRTQFSIQGTRALSSNIQAMQITSLSGNETTEELLARLRADSEVEAAEIDRPVYLHAMPNDVIPNTTVANDPSNGGVAVSGQWYLRAQDSVKKSAINAVTAWDTTKGSNGVVVAVLDTGVRFDHPDLGRASLGGKFLPGYDFVSDLSIAADGDNRDFNAQDPGDACGASSSSWHGTRVSGMISAMTDNNIGIAGVLWNGYILPVRVLGRCSGSNSDVLAGMRWAAGLSVPGVPTNPYPAKVLNLSLGSEDSCDSISAQVVREVTDAGALVVVSAGNEGGPVDSPASCPGAMGVAGIRHAGTKVGYSSLGPQIGIAAPAGNCVNTAAGTPCVYTLDTTSNAGATTPGSSIYTSPADPNFGTSFSSPIVSGIGGLMLAANGNLKSAQLIARLKEGALPFPTTSDSAGTVPVCHVPVNRSDVQEVECICTTAACGAGMANAKGAVDAAMRPIAAISLPASFSAGQNITLSGLGSAAACGRTLSSTTPYAWTVDGVPAPNADSVVVTVPPSGTTVTVRLTVTDDAGKSDIGQVFLRQSPGASTSDAPVNAGNTACLTDVTLPVGVTITALDATAAEGGTDTGTFLVSRMGSTTAALTVNVSISGTATNGIDYQAVTASVVIPAGATSALIAVNPIDDSIVDAAESVTAFVLPAVGIDPGFAVASIVITDNDTTPTVPQAPSGGGGGGGGALDLLTLLALMTFAARFALLPRLLALNRRAASESESDCRIRI